MRRVSMLVWSAIRGRDGYALAMVAVALPTLLLMAGLVIDWGTLAYYQSKAEAAAEASVIAAVRDQRRIPLPIPTFCAPVACPGPVWIKGFFVQVLYLKNVTWGGGAGNLVTAMARENAGPQAQVEVSEFPEEWVPFPLRHVRVKVTRTVDLPFSGRLGGSPTVSAEACALAWVRTRFWIHDLWGDETFQLFTDNNLELTFYRQVKCTGMGSLSDIIALADKLWPLIDDVDGGKGGLKQLTVRLQSVESASDKMKGASSREQARQFALGGEDRWSTSPPSAEDWRREQAERGQRCREKTEELKAQHEKQAAEYRAVRRKWEAQRPEERGPEPQPPEELDLADCPS